MKTTEIIFLRQRTVHVSQGTLKEKQMSLECVSFFLLTVLVSAESQLMSNTWIELHTYTQFQLSAH